jgi:8-oxo-dGTP pyrophosphatase MutT (NUDIX family)
MPSTTGYLRHFEVCNKHDMSAFAPFFIGAKRYGSLKKDLAAFLMQETSLFEAKDGGLALRSSFDTFEDRSAALMQATLALGAKLGKALRNEMFPVIEKWGDQPLAQLDRVAVPWFGVRAWGLHVNGFVRKKDGLYLWIGERAADRQVEPGKLDNMIGGGNPIGITVQENLCKEAREEAGIDPALALTAQHVGEISYKLQMADGLRNDTLFIFDLELPEDFTPRNTDGEVAAFYLKPAEEVAELVRDTDQFKFNCGMVVAEFLMRHGVIKLNDAESAAAKAFL